MPAPETPPRPSSTLVLLREGRDAQVEVLMLLRGDRGDQNSLRWVFPGGLVDASDEQLRTRFHDLDDGVASERLGIAAGGLDYWTAALRETLEEAGLLMALDAQGQAVDGARHAQELAHWRVESRGLPRGQGGAAFAALCARHGWRLPGDAVLPFAHWITPLGMPKRFDTRFFVAAAPDQEVEIDDVEVIEHRWVPVADLAAQRSDVGIRGPTLAVMKDLARHATLGAMLHWARHIGRPAPVQPRLALDARGQRTPVPPWHPAYAEVGRVDPQGRGLAYADIRPGSVVDLAGGRLLRVTAPNGNVYTGPGTNTYLLRAAGDDWVVLDPGPDDASHVQALQRVLHARGARLVAIVVTHTHADHSPAAQALRAATGAPVMGRVADIRAGQDPHFAPQRVLADGERIDFGGGCVLRVLHTPGHASNHLCYLHEELRLLFSGDHVMQGSTVVIGPPDGDMAAYVASLRRVAAEAGTAFDAIAPGHGFLIGQPAQTLQVLLRHRQRRESKVRAALLPGRGQSVEELLPHVYDDVPPARHPIAARSLLAHLLHLQHQGQAHGAGGLWQLAASPAA